MGMKRLCEAAMLILLVAIAGSLSFAQSGRVAYAHQASLKPRDGFFDFVLKRINSSGTDYGQCLVESRRMLVEETIRNAYYWSNVVSLSMLACLFFIVLYQNKIQAKRELEMAEMVGQFAQSLARSRLYIAEATKKNGDLADALAALKQSPSRLAPEPEESALAATTKSRTTTMQPASPAPTKTNSARTEVGSAAHPDRAKERIGQMRLFAPDTDFVMKLNSLEQQLAQSQEDNKQLRRRIADGDRKPEATQDRNRQFKGA